MPETLREVLALILFAIGAFFALTGAVGILRMPDFWSRLHPAGKTDTLAQTLVLLGILVNPNRYPGEWNDPLKLVSILILLYITAPTATHAVSRAAYAAGLGRDVEHRDAGQDSADAPKEVDA